MAPPGNRKWVMGVMESKEVAADLITEAVLDRCSEGANIIREVPGLPVRGHRQEKRERLLVAEFMPNETLSKQLFHCFLVQWVAHQTDFPHVINTSGTVFLVKKKIRRARKHGSPMASALAPSSLVGASLVRSLKSRKRFRQGQLVMSGSKD